MRLIDRYSYLHRCNLRRQEIEALQQLNDMLRCHEPALTIIPRLAETLPLTYVTRTEQPMPRAPKMPNIYFHQLLKSKTLYARHKAPLYFSLNPVSRTAHRLPPDVV